MSYNSFKFLHILGFIFILSGLVFVNVVNHLHSKPTIKLRLYGSVIHGLGMAFVLYTGLKMAQLLNFIEWPTWLKYKIAIWLFLGLSISLAKRNSKNILINFTIFFALAAIAIHIALTKGFTLPI